MSRSATYYHVDIPYRASAPPRQSAYTLVSKTGDARSSTYRRSRSFPFQLVRYLEKTSDAPPSSPRLSPDLRRRSVLPYIKALNWQSMLRRGTVAMASTPTAAFTESSISRTSALVHDASQTDESDRTPRAVTPASFSNLSELGYRNGDASSDGVYHSAAASIAASSSSTSLSTLSRSKPGRSEFRPAVRIQVSTPKHRRACSDVSITSLRDLSLDSEMTCDEGSTIASLASELEELATRLPARPDPTGKATRAKKNARPRSNTTSLAGLGGDETRGDGRPGGRRLSASSTISASAAAAAMALTATAPPLAAATSSAVVTAIAGRRRSQTIGTDSSRSVRRFRTSNQMQSISEEGAMRSPVRPHTGNSAWSTSFSPGNPSHERWSRDSVAGSMRTSMPSPGTPDFDYVRFIDSDYRSSPSWNVPSPLGTPMSSSSHSSTSSVSAACGKAHLPRVLISGGSGSSSSSHGSYRSRNAAPSRLLAEQAAWLQEELARCSSDEEGIESPDPYLLPLAGGLGAPECFSTPSSSPMIAQRDAFMRLPSGEDLLGLGLDTKTPILAAIVPSQRRASDPERQAGGRNRSSSKSSAGDATRSSAQPSNRRSSTIDFGTTKRDSLQPPPMAWRQSSLSPQRGSSDRFASTQPESFTLFEDGSYSPSSSPMADNGHGDVASPLTTQQAKAVGHVQQRRRPSSSESSDSTHSSSSHASSLLSPCGLGPASMERNLSVDTKASSRPSSIVSNVSDKQAPGRPARSPQRTEKLLASLEGSEVGHGIEDGSSSSKHHGCRRPLQSSKLGNRRTSLIRPQLPARMTSLDESVAAAPRQMQLREEFPERLLGDFLAGGCDGNDDDIYGDGARFSVSPLPFSMMMRSDSQTVSLPGIGEIIPPSPDISKELLGLAPALKRLGGVPGSADELRASMSNNASWTSLAAHADEEPTLLDRSPSRMGTLKARLTGRLGSSIDLIRATSASMVDLTEEAAVGSESSGTSFLQRSAADASASFAPAKSNSAINRLIKGGMMLGKKSKDNLGGQESPRLPAAWEDRLGSNKGLVRRNSSRMSGNTDSPPDSARGDMFLDFSSPRRRAAMQQAGKEAPQSATPSFASYTSEETKSRASSSFWRMLSPSANASSASLVTGSAQSRGSQSPEAVSASVSMARQRSASDVKTSFDHSRQPQPSQQLGLHRSPSQVSYGRPSRSIEVQRSFFDLSEEDEDEAEEAQTSRLRSRSRLNGRKDLSKLFGASESDLTQTMASMAANDRPAGAAVAADSSGADGRSGKKTNNRWTASLGRSSKRQQQQSQQQQGGRKIAA